MARRFAQLIGGVVLAVAVLGAVFVTGMRAKSPFVLDAVRRSGRATKRFVLTSSGTPGGLASVIRHVGRTSGRAYETPVQAVPTADGFVIALPYGPNTDWLKNVVTRGSATIVHEGLTAEVDRPEIVPMSVAAAHFSPKDQRTHRLFRVEEALVVRHAEPSTASSASCTRTDRTGQRSAAAPTWT
jgi:deazaflavin-dependent oxidoreductase (nitroreductase family)